MSFPYNPTLLCSPSNLRSVIALSKLFELNDPRVTQTQVKGDMIIPASDRIMTRSRAKQSASFIPIPDRELPQICKLTSQ